MSGKKDAKARDSLPAQDTDASLIPQGSAPARELMPSATDLSRFAGVLPTEEPTNDTPQSFHRHPISDELDIADEELARLGLIIPAEVPPSPHEYTVDSDEEEGDSRIPSSSGGSSLGNKKNRGGAELHSALNQKRRKGSKHGKSDELPSTPLNTVAEVEEAGPFKRKSTHESSLVKTPTTATDPSEQSKSKQKSPYPENLHSLIPLRFVTATPRLSPMEYTRLYYTEKAKCDEEGTECFLLAPEAYWAWTENYDKFLCVPRMPRAINRKCFGANLEGAPKYVHTEIPTLRRLPKSNDKRVRKAVSHSDFGWARLTKLATGSRNRLFKRAKEQAEAETQRVSCKTPVLPPINVGGSRLSVGYFAIRD